jgi:hypothetical protein
MLRREEISVLVTHRERGIDTISTTITNKRVAWRYMEPELWLEICERTYRR